MSEIHGMSRELIAKIVKQTIQNDLMSNWDETQAYNFGGND